MAESITSRSFPDPSDPEARLDAVMARGRSLRRRRLVRRSGIASAVACTIAVASLAVAASGADTEEVVAVDAPHATTSAIPTSASTSTSTAAPPTTTTWTNITTTTSTTAPPTAPPPTTSRPPAATGQSTTIATPPVTTPITTTTAAGLPPMNSLTVRVEGPRVILEDLYAPVPGNGGESGEMCVAVALVATSATSQPGSEPIWHTSYCLPYGDSEVEPLMAFVISSNDLWLPGPDYWRTPLNSEPRVGPITSYVAARAVFEVPLDAFFHLAAGTYPLRVIAYSGYRMWQMNNHTSFEGTVTLP